MLKMTNSNYSDYIDGNNLMSTYKFDSIFQQKYISFLMFRVYVFMRIKESTYVVS